MFIRGSIQIYRSDQSLPGPAARCPQKMGGSADDGRRHPFGFLGQIMPSDHRHPQLAAPFRHSLGDQRSCRFIRSAQHIHHSHRPAAHGVNIAYAYEHCAVTRPERILLHQPRNDSVTRHQQVTLGTWKHGGIIADRVQHSVWIPLELLQGNLNILLSAKSGGFRQVAHKLLNSFIRQHPPIQVDMTSGRLRPSILTGRHSGIFAQTVGQGGVMG